jgi:hypothetical protein
MIGLIGTYLQLQSIITAHTQSWPPRPLFILLLGLRLTAKVKVKVKVKVRVKVTLRLAVYCQSVRLGARPLETQRPENFYFQLNWCGNSPFVTSSLTRNCVRLLRLYLAFHQGGNKAVGNVVVAWPVVPIFTHTFQTLAYIPLKWQTDQ